MGSAQEISDLLTGSARVIFISESQVDLHRPGDNRLLLLKMVEGSLAAGGRGAGFGERKVERVVLFRCSGVSCDKLFDTVEPSLVGLFEVPYYVSRIPFTAADGSERVGYGATDPDLVEEYSRRAIAAGLMGP
jgi:hypothetical protein